MYLNFNEINILRQNLLTANKIEFCNILFKLEKNTKDAMLLYSIRSLSKKILACTQEQFEILIDDIKDESITTTIFYKLPEDKQVKGG